MKGTNVCRMHGGSASQVREKAQERLDQMADSVTADMQEIIDDLADLYEDAPPEEKAAIASELRKNWKAILDRTGHGPTETRELSGEDGGPVEVVIGGDE
jgi:predicted transcriptional regulator